jgi:cardiolipin synthase
MNHQPDRPAAFIERLARGVDGWRAGHRAHLLENGEAYFPAVFDAIRGARSEVLIETFILFEDKVGNELREVLVRAARRGVSVDLLVDGYGSADLSAAFLQTLLDAGVRVRSFDPGRRLFGQRLNPWRRMHRKLVVVDARVAFVGGINFAADQLGDYGPMAKQDYAVQIEGPLVRDMRSFALRAIGRPQAEAPRCDAHVACTGGVDARFVTRDNRGHPSDIERQYRAAIRAARSRIVIANAYFFPGYRLLRQLSRAARRGVDVRLVLQGEPDMPIVRKAARLLYEHLQRDGVKVHEYCRRPLHGKVAVVDDEWATVGSSNLDPLSLALNLEANVILRGGGFPQHLRERLDDLIENDCHLVEPRPRPALEWWQRLRSALLFHVLRHFPRWARQLPEHQPRLVLPPAATIEDAQPAGDPAQGRSLSPPARAHAG